MSKITADPHQRQISIIIEAPYSVGGRKPLPILTFRNLTKYISNHHSSSLFSGVSSHIDRSDNIAVTGPSGQGKSTLLRILAKIDALDEGEMFLHGVSSRDVQGRYWRTKVAYLTQQATMLPGSVEDNLKMVSKLHQAPFDLESAESWMERIGLGALDWRKSASELSGGEKQRLALTRMLLARPEILMLDEATSALDETNKSKVEELLRNYQESVGTALVWITHDQEQIKRVAKRIWHIFGGTMVEDPENEGGIL
jgi:putative ABC transport system ATP-binding protein